MADLNLLYETYEFYYKKAKYSYENKDMGIARRNFLLAAEQLLKMAKESQADTQNKYYLQAKMLIDFADNIKVASPILEGNVLESNISSVSDNTSCTLESALSELNALEGLETVKKEVSDWIDQIKVFKMRKEKGMSVPEMSYHMVFAGNPGTGKTTVARIMAKIYRALGVVSKGQLVECDRSELVAGYVGQTAINVKNIVNKAKGGVLFIDEAYSLSLGGNGDFGTEAINTLLKAMEDNRADLVVIVAGYDNLMDKFIESNPGLRSRFKTYVHFSDYNGNELYNIFKKMCQKNEYCIEKTAQILLREYFNSIYKNRNTNFGNARDVRNLFEAVITYQSKRIASADSPSTAAMSMILTEDLPEYIREASSDLVLDMNDKDPKSSSDVDTPEDRILNDAIDTSNSQFKFDWDSLPNITFEDVAGLESVKEAVKIKVLLPLKNPEAFEGYVKKSGGGLLLYGPPGTGKTMIAAAIANEIGAKFCSIKPSDLLHQGAGQSEKAVRALFSQARQYPCSVIYFDEMDSISPKNTRSQYAKQMRSELLAQLQGIESYTKDNGNILFLIAATNKPWEIDSAFLRPGRFGTKIYIGLPDALARKYMFETRLNNIKKKGIVHISDDIDLDDMVERTDGFNGSDITNLMDRIEELSILRNIDNGGKYIIQSDFDLALSEITSSVQFEDIEKLADWKE